MIGGAIMNGETYQIARVVSAAKKAMVEKKEFHFVPIPYENKITFHFSAKRGFFGHQERAALTPDEWFEACRKEGMREIFMRIQTESQGRLLLGFANTKPVNITAFFKNGDVHVWTPKWVFDTEHKNWNVDYTEQLREDAPHGLPEFLDNTERFRSVLTEIEKFAGIIGARDFAAIFGKARSILDDEEAFIDDPGFPELPAKNRSLFKAAMTADVFGAMGSWNDSPPYLAHKKCLDAEYERLSAELLKQMRFAAMYAVNQWIY